MTGTADLILTGDVVLTVDADGTVIRRGAVAITDGSIVAVGPIEDVLERFSAESIIDSPGCIIMPGWVNTHTHLAMNVFRGAADDVTLEEFLERLIGAELRSLTEEMVSVGARAAIAECIAGGTTTALDMYWHPQAARAVAREAGFRLLNGPTFMGERDPEGRDFAAMLARAESILIENRGDADAELWVMPHSTYTLSREQLQRIQELAERFDARINTHASESLGELATVAARHQARPIAVLDEAGLIGPRTVLAHAVHLDSDEIGRIAQAGATVAHCPISNLKLACGIAPVPALLGAHASVGLGTDGAASAGSLDMKAVVTMAALLHKGVSFDPTMIDAERAVRLGTVDGARGLGLTTVGTIEVGMAADLQVVRADGLNTAPTTDPWSAIVYGSTAADVRHVVIDGRVVMRDRELQTIDQQSALRELVDVAAQAFAATQDAEQ